MEVTLLPLAKFEDDLLAYIDRNLRELGDALGRLANVETNTNAVTGSLTVDSGLAEIDNVQVWFAQKQTANAAYVSVELLDQDTFPGQFNIWVLKSDFTASTTAVNIGWQAVGE